MHIVKDKRQRKSGQVTPAFHKKKYTGIWFSTGSAIILISVIVSTLLGFWILIF